MTAPNIVDVATILGISYCADLSTTLTTTLITGASENVNKINLIRVTNVTDNDANNIPIVVLRTIIKSLFNLFIHFVSNVPK